MLRTAICISVLFVAIVGCEREAPKTSSGATPAAGAAQPSATKPASPAPTTAAPSGSAAKPAASPALAGKASPAAAGAAGNIADFPEPDLSKLQMPMQMRIGSVRQAARSDPNDLSKMLELGSLLYAQGFFPEAAMTFQRATAVMSDDFAIWYMIGRARDKAGDNRGAAEMYEKAIAVQSAWFDAHPDQQRAPYSPAFIRLAGVLFDGSPARASEALRKALELDPNDPAAHAGLGTIAQKAGKTDEAIQHFRMSLDLSPQYGYAHSGIAAAYAAKGSADQAALHREQTRGDDPYVPASDPIEIVTLRRGMQVDVLLMEANEYLRRRDFVQAEQSIQQAIDADASGIRGRTMLGLLRSLQNKHEEAVREYRAVLRIDPNSVPTRMALADSLANANKADEAETILREIIAGDPKATNALDQLARLLASKSRVDDAVALINQTVEKAGDDARALTSIAETMTRIGRPADARTLAERAVKLSPHLAEARNVLGYLLARANDEDGAMREWRDALKIAPHYSAPRIQLVQVLYARKDRAGMEKELREGVESNPYSVDMLNSLAWLLATSPTESQRNAAEAILFAERADALTNSSNHAVLDTLAAAYAEAERYSDAQTRIAGAIALAREAGLTRELQDYQKRLELYLKQQPYHEP